MRSALSSWSRMIKAREESGREMVGMERKRVGEAAKKR